MSKCTNVFISTIAFIFALNLLSLGCTFYYKLVVNHRSQQVSSSSETRDEATSNFYPHHHVSSNEKPNRLLVLPNKNPQFDENRLKRRKRLRGVSSSSGRRNATVIVDSWLQSSEEQVREIVPELLEYAVVNPAGPLPNVSSSRSRGNTHMLEHVLEHGLESNLEHYRLRHFGTMEQALAAYTQFYRHQNGGATNSGEAPPFSSAHILIVTPVEGWGNMVRAITSALYVALITGRVLYVNMPRAPLSRYFVQKEENPDWSVPSSIDIVQHCVPFRLDNCVGCEKNREQLRTVPLQSLLVHHCMNLVSFSPLDEMLIQNPSTKSVFQRFDTHGDWSLIYRYFSFDQPTSMVEDKLPFDAPEALRSETVVGVQIRTGIIDYHDTYRFITIPTAGRVGLCARRIMEAYRQHGSSQRATEATGNGDNGNNNRTSEKSAAAAVFLSTDNPAVHQLFHRVLSPLEQQSLGDNPSILYYLEPQFGHSNSNERALDDAIVDWIALSRSNVILASYHSSFADTARRVHNVKTYWIAEENVGTEVNLSHFHLSVPPICANLFPYIKSH